MSLTIHALKLAGKTLKASFRGSWKVRAKIRSVFENSHKPLLADTVELSMEAAKRNICPRISDLRLDKKTIKSLMEIEDNNKLVEKTRNIFCDRLGIPEELRPDVYWVNYRGFAAAGYIPQCHQIQIYENAKKQLEKGKFSKRIFISILGHELEHCRQNIQVLSTSGLSDKAVSFWSKKMSNTYAQSFVSNITSLPIEEIEKLINSGQLPDISLPFAKKILTLKKQNTTDYASIISEIAEHDLPECKKVWERLRDIAKKQIIPIHPGTKEALESEILFKALFTPIVPSRTLSIKLLQYIKQLTERLAFKKQKYILSNLIFDS